MKKTFKIFIIVTVMVTIFIQIFSIKNVEFASSSVSEVMIEASSKYVSPGDYVTATVVVNGSDNGVSGFQGTIKFDTDILEFYSKSVLLSGWSCTGYNSNTGIFLVELSNISNTSAYITGKQELISFTFKVKDDVEAPCVAEINLSNIITVNSSVLSKTASDSITILSSSSSYKYVTIGTTLADLQSDLGDSITLYTSSGGTVTSTSARVATGMYLSFVDSSTYYTYYLAIRGDLTGDGYCNDADLLKLARYRADLTTLDGSYLLAADINNDGSYAR